MTIAVEGPPGVGKSSLMCQFIEEMRSLPPTESGGRLWLPVLLSASDVESLSYLADTIDAVIVSKLAADLLAFEGEARQSVEKSSFVEKLSEYWGGDINLDKALMKAREFFDRGGSVMGFSLGASLKGPPKTIAKAVSRRINAWQSWQIVLMIDEAQGIHAGGRHVGEWNPKRTAPRYC